MINGATARKLRLVLWAFLGVVTGAAGYFILFE